jgi:hypothetical protein
VRIIVIVRNQISVILHFEILGLAIMAPDNHAPITRVALNLAQHTEFLVSETRRADNSSVVSENRSEDWNDDKFLNNPLIKLLLRLHIIDLEKGGMVLHPANLPSHGVPGTLEVHKDPIEPAAWTTHPDVRLLADTRELGAVHHDVFR